VSLLRRLTAFSARAATREPSLLLILAAVAGAIWLFVEVADEVLEGEMRALDRAIILALRSAGDPNDPLGPRWVEEMMRDFTALGGLSILTVMVLAVAGYLLLADKRRTALLVVVASVGGILLGAALKYGFGRPRPDLVSHGAMVYTASFPSGHAMMSAIVYLTLGTLLASVEPNVRIKLYLFGVALLLTALVGISRVYLGVHWPTDVVAGWAAGLAWALLLWWFSLWFGRGRGNGAAG
jgi:undecaprenyl-diphosphatase